MTARIVSVFPRSGREEYYKEYSRYSPENKWRTRNNGNQVFNNMGIACGEKIINIKMTDFLFMPKENEDDPNKKNNDFPGNFIGYIKEKAFTEDIILIGSSSFYRDALKENNIKYHIFYPRKDQKKEWVKRYSDSEKDKYFLEILENSWDSIIDSIEEDDFPIKCRLHTDWTNSSTVNPVTMMQFSKYEDL